MIRTAMDDARQTINELPVGNLLSRRRSQLANVECRGPALSLLNNLQIKILRAWREQKDKNPAGAEKFLPLLLMTTKAISGGLKHSG